MAIRYCVGSPLNSTAAWSTTSGGASGASVPVAADDAVFDAASPSCSVGTARSFLTLNFTGYTNTITMNANITVAGNITLGAGMTIVDSGGFLLPNGTGTLTSNGKAWNAALQFTAAATYTLADQWDVATLGTGNVAAVVNGTKLRVAGNWTITGTTGQVLTGTVEIELYGTGTVASSLTTGAVRTNVTFAAGSNYTVTGVFSYGTNLLKRDVAATLNVSAATLRTALSCSIDMSGSAWAGYTSLASITVTLVSVLTVGTFAPDNGSLTFAGAKLTVTGTTTLLATSGVITVPDLDFVGTLTVSGAFTTGRLTGNVTFVSGTITLTGTLSHGGGNLTKAAGCTLVTTDSTLILQGAASTVDLSPAVMNNVTIVGAFTHVLNSILYVAGTYSIGSTTVITTINGSEVCFTGTSITSLVTTGGVTGTSPLRIKETCSLNAPNLTTGAFRLPHIIDAPGKTITLTKWIAEVSTWQILAGTVINAAGQTWVNTQLLYQRTGRVIDTFILPGSNPRLYFRAWTNDTVPIPFTTLMASGISSAQYRRRVGNVWSSAVNVGTLSDGTELQAYSVGRVIKHNCPIGNLYSIDAPLAATNAGAEAVRLYLTLSAGTADVYEHVLIINAQTLTSGTGARTITITVTDGTDFLENAVVRLTNGALSVTAVTNVSGVATLYVDDATYSVSATKAGYSYSGSSLTVDGDETVTVAMTPVSITPSEPALATGVYVTYDQYGEIEAGVSVSMKLRSLPKSDLGNVHDDRTVTVVSNSAGVCQFVNRIPGAYYYVWRGEGSEEIAASVKIPVDAEDGFLIASFFGNDET